MQEWKIVSAIVLILVISLFSLPIEVIWWADIFYMKISLTIVCISLISLIWFMLYSINKN